MNRFNFEKNLSHQSIAVESIVSVFNNVNLITPAEIYKIFFNPYFYYLKYYK